MQFLHNDLGYLAAGQTIEVALDVAANVKLMDGGNFNSYRNGRQHKYYGGYATYSRTHITVPNAGHWHIAIDLAGRRGTIRSSVRVLD